MPNQIDLSLSILPSPRTGDTDVLGPEADGVDGAHSADSVVLAAVAALHSGASSFGSSEVAFKSRAFSGIGLPH